ncbi:MAG: hypothetical protein ACLFSQ_07120 [Candidatus Zixiibacteriota bacterium]
MAKKNSSSGKAFPKITVITFAIIIVLFILYASLSLIGFMQAPEKAKKLDEVDEENRIKIVVFNGCQNSKKTLQITDMIRENADIDVVDIIKSPGTTYPRTMILQRQIEDEKVKKLAKIIGLKQEDIIKQRSNQFVDATLVIGIDHEVLWKTLKTKWN